MTLSLEEGVNVARDRIRVIVARVALDRLAGRRDEEFLEVPCDVGASDWGPQNDGRAAEFAARQHEGCSEERDSIGGSSAHTDETILDVG